MDSVYLPELCRTYYLTTSRKIKKDIIISKSEILFTAEQNERRNKEKPSFLGL